MNSHELAEYLLAQPDVTVVLSRDAEGNDFRVLEDFQFMKWNVGDEYPVHEELPDADSVVVLWPV